MNTIPQPGRRNWVTARFSFKGRASRLEFLLQGLGALLLFLAAAAIIIWFCLTGHLWLAARGGHTGHSIGLALLWALIPLILVDFLLFTWAVLAVDARRGNDFATSPSGSVASFFSLRSLFSRGTIGPNLHGPDPLQK